MGLPNREARQRRLWCGVAPACFARRRRTLANSKEAEGATARSTALPKMFAPPNAATPHSHDRVQAQA